MEDYFRVGVFASTHGVRGEINLFPTTEDSQRFHKGLPLFLDTGKEMLPLTVEGFKYFKNMVILKFEGYNNINDIEKYKGKELYVDRAHAIPLEEGEYYISDILGAEVISDENEKIGKLVDVMQTGANDVYIIKRPNGKEVLFPVIKECVLDVDTEQKVVRVHVMKGLLD